MTSSDFVFGSNIIVLLYCSMHFVASLLQSSYSQRCDVKTFGKPTFVDAWHPNRSQFHQHFMHTFCSNILAPKITKLCFGFEIFWCQNISKKVHVKCWWNWLQWCLFWQFYSLKFIHMRPTPALHHVPTRSVWIYWPKSYS